MRKFLTVLIFNAFLFHAYAARAENSQAHALMTPEEQDLQVKAKKRLYPGGKDEEPLKVQTQLPAVTRKMGPAVEAPEQETTGGETD